ncbi:MAG: bifunctional precorrin-2 dehydrogenase/sirohydrochlorin ferrochelatase [Methanolinea sp.]|jgi:precorrin-2 dehydrogenase/sirohydrochlorin ferrochelatase|nr:bifunctional precorrin-2 dehydrogenase/sirohydrochlorin ferrochelatase [Methanolinea sp.]
MIPLLVDFSKKKVAIFGGGDVGARKAAFFAREGSVIVYSRSFSPTLMELPVTRVTIDLEEITDEKLLSLLGGIFCAVAATPDPKLNNRIGEACRRKNILFNNAEGEQGDFLIPSVVRGEHFILAISTEGASPAIPRFIREHLEETFPHLDRMVSVQERLRAYLRECQPDPEARREILWNVLKDRDVWAALQKGETYTWSLIAGRYLA